jgi:hypothetical protein
VAAVEWKGARVDARRPPLSPLSRQALADHAGDTGNTESERVDAAVRLAVDGEFAALRGLLQTPGLYETERLRAAGILAELGDDSALVALAEGLPHPDYYVPDPAGGPALRYGALKRLYSARHPAATPLLRRFARAVTAPAAYGAAAMLGQEGRLDALVDLATRADQPQLAMVAARRLAAYADDTALAQAAERTPDGAARAWLLAGLVQGGRIDCAPEVHQLIRSSPFEGQLELLAVLAAAGDVQAVDELRRKAARSIWRMRRLSAVIALAAAGDAAGRRRLHDASRQGTGRVKVRAAAALGTLGFSANWQQLRTLAEAARPRVRLRAATRLLHETAFAQPLVQLVADETAPLSCRVYAADALGRSMEQPALTGPRGLEVYSRAGYSVRVDEDDLSETPVGAYRRLPSDQAAQLTAVGMSAATPARLRIAIAHSGLPHETAIDVLRAVIQQRSRYFLHAAHALNRYAPAEAERQLRALAVDDTAPRYLRWAVLFSQWEDEPDWPEFTREFARISRLLNGTRWLLAPRLMALALRRPGARAD